MLRQISSVRNLYNPMQKIEMRENNNVTDYFLLPHKGKQLGKYGQTPGFLREYLYMFMGLRGSRDGSPIKKEQSFQRSSHQACLPQILKVELVGLPFELPCDYQQVVVEDVELIEEQTVPFTELAYQQAILNWLQKGVLLLFRITYCLLPQIAHIIEDKSDLAFAISVFD